MFSVDSENHVLSFPGEDVEDDVSCSGAEFDSLCVEDFFGEFRGGDYDEVALSHAEEEDFAEAFG